MKIKKLENDSLYTGKLPEGCKYCRRGSKMVLLVTGRCESTCWYCPLSEEKKGKVVLFANEKRTDSEEEIVEEAYSIDAEGTGITGGDPLMCINTQEYIRLLKSEFGEDHHIHLYTRSTEIDKIRSLVEAGLDEIRFHPPVEVWDEIEETDYPLLLETLKDLDIDVGIEIPCIPEMERETIILIKSLEELVDFVNLNELEFSSTNWKQMVKRGYKKKSDVSSAVKGSQEMALKILKSDFKVPIHYCSASFKDGVQLSNRIKRRAQNTAKEGELVTEEGTLIKGIILADEPLDVLEELREFYGIPDSLIWYDSENDRIEIALAVLEEICDEIEYDCYGIEEYPTADRLEVERWPVKDRKD
ncbi:MAG: radical SAM protein [Candidatus Saliniplasma sp.]